MSAALGLLRLQQVDSRLNQMQGRIDQIRVTLESDADLQEAREDLEHAQALQAKCDDDRQAAETEAKALRLKIQQAEASLYGGKVRNPKELQDLEADVASLKKHLATVDEQELSSMVSLEQRQNAVRLSLERLDAVKSRLEEQRVRLTAEEGELLRDRAALEAERQAALGALAPRHLETYEDLRKVRRGIAVAQVIDNACDACGTRLTASEQQNARHAAELVHCPSCGRILYAG